MLWQTRAATAQTLPSHPAVKASLSPMCELVASELGRIHLALDMQASIDRPHTICDIDSLPVHAVAYTESTPDEAPTATERRAGTALRAYRPSIHVLLGGNDFVVGTAALRQRTSAWEGIYEQPHVVGRFGLEIHYLNEGYLGPSDVPWSVRLDQPLHYRDTYGAQLNYWPSLLSNCRVGVSAGPELYFDTTAGTYRAQYQDKHGPGVLPSAATQCRIGSRWALELRANRCFDIASFDATTLLLGLSYTPQAREAEEDGSDGVRRTMYLELTAGRTEIDSFRVSQERGPALWLTYGASLSPSFAVEASMLNENVANVMQRRGLALQLIAQHDFGFLQMFAGAGPELARIHNDATHGVGTQGNLLLSYGVEVPVSSRLSALVKIGRVESASKT